MVSVKVNSFEGYNCPVFLSFEHAPTVGRQGEVAPAMGRCGFSCSCKLLVSFFSGLTLYLKQLLAINVDKLYEIFRQ